MKETLSVNTYTYVQLLLLFRKATASKIMR